VKGLKKKLFVSSDLRWLRPAVHLELETPFIEKKKKKKKLRKSKKKNSMGLNLRFSHLTSTSAPFKHMNFSRNGNKRSSIKSKNKDIAVIKFQEWLNVMSTLVFDVLMQTIKI
jgi:hypothetical protein